MVDELLIKKYIEDISKFSSTKEDGTTRLSFTKEEQAARQYIKQTMKDIGLLVREDAAGTIIGRIEGADKDAPVVMLGSHYDTVEHGGNFDGVAGVAAAMEVARCFIQGRKKNYNPIEIVAMIEEEGIRFGVGLFASKAMAGVDGKEILSERVDKNGISMAQAMRECGFDPDKFEEARRERGSIKAFLELHIEQSIQLERNNIDIGIVNSVVGNHHMNVEITGNADHAGGTPMNMRHDALVAAAGVVTYVNSSVKKYGAGNVATIGKLEVYPNVRNIVPQRVTFMVDNRSIDSLRLDSTTDEIRDEVRQACEQNGCRYIIKELKKVAPVSFDEKLTSLIKESADSLGYSNMFISSGAGHDAMIMSSIAPAAMVFVPSRDGKSHCKEEYTSYEDIKKGTEVLYRVVEKLVME